METLEFVKSNPDIIFQYIGDIFYPKLLLIYLNMVVLTITLHFYHTIGEKILIFGQLLKRLQPESLLHYIDSGIDTGKVISQKKVFVEPVDTGGSLYKKLEIAFKDLH